MGKISWESLNASPKIQGLNYIRTSAFPPTFWGVNPMPLIYSNTSTSHLGFGLPLFAIVRFHALHLRCPRSQTRAGRNQNLTKQFSRNLITFCDCRSTEPMFLQPKKTMNGKQANFCTTVSIHPHSAPFSVFKTWGPSYSVLPLH